MSYRPIYTRTVCPVHIGLIKRYVPYVFVLSSLTKSDDFFSSTFTRDARFFAIVHFTALTCSRRKLLAPTRRPSVAGEHDRVREMDRGGCDVSKSEPIDIFLIQALVQDSSCGRTSKFFQKALRKVSITCLACC